MHFLNFTRILYFLEAKPLPPNCAFIPMILLCFEFYILLWMGRTEITKQQCKLQLRLLINI